MALYEPYVSSEYYFNVFKGTTLTAENADLYLKNASDHIDILTFNRIVARKFENLTDFQQDIIKKTICKLADFEKENEDVINSMLSNYSINGVSMSFGNSWNVKIIKGIAIPTNLYEFLGQSGLTCLNVRC